MYDKALRDIVAVGQKEQWAQASIKQYLQQYSN